VDAAAVCAVLQLFRLLLLQPYESLKQQQQEQGQRASDAQQSGRRWKQNPERIRHSFGITSMSADGYCIHV